MPTSTVQDGGHLRFHVDNSRHLEISSRWFKTNLGLVVQSRIKMSVNFYSSLISLTKRCKFMRILIALRFDFGCFQHRLTIHTVCAVCCAFKMPV